PSLCISPDFRFFPRSGGLKRSSAAIFRLTKTRCDDGYSGVPSFDIAFQVKRQKTRPYNKAVYWPLGLSAKKFHLKACIGRRIKTPSAVAGGQEVQSRRRQ